MGTVLFFFVQFLYTPAQWKKTNEGDDTIWNVYNTTAAYVQSFIGK